MKCSNGARPTPDEIPIASPVLAPPTKKSGTPSPVTVTVFVPDENATAPVPGSSVFANNDAQGANDDAQVLSVPVLGRVAAGAFALTADECDYRVSVDREMLRGAGPRASTSARAQRCVARALHGARACGLALRVTPRLGERACRARVPPASSARSAHRPPRRREERRPR